MADCCCSPLGPGGDTPASSAKFLLASFSADTNAGAANGFLGPFGSAARAQESRCQISLPQDCTITDVQFHADTVGGVSATTQAALRVNGVNSALIPTIAPGEQNADATGSISYTAGQLLSVVVASAPDFATSSYSFAVYGTAP